MEREKILEELIALSEKSEIQYSKKQLEKMDTERLERILERHRAQELDDLNEAIVDTVIGKFDELMKGCKFISKTSDMGRRLKEKKLFRQDMKSFVSWFTPLFPYVGLLEGAICVANEVIKNPDRDNKNDDEVIRVNLKKGVNKFRLPRNPIMTHEDQNLTIQNCSVKWQAYNVKVDNNDKFTNDGNEVTVPQGYYTFSSLKNFLVDENITIGKNADGTVNITADKNLNLKKFGQLLGFRENQSIPIDYEN